MSKQKGLMYQIDKEISETYKYLTGTYEGNYLIAKGVGIGVGLFCTLVYLNIPEHSQGFLQNAKTAAGLFAGGCFLFTGYATLDSMIYNSRRNKEKQLKAIKREGNLESLVDDNEKYVESKNFRKK